MESESKLNQSPSAPAKVTEFPKTAQPETMWFTDALDALLGGAKQIRRLCWPEGEYLFFGQAISKGEDGTETPFETLMIRRGDVDRLWSIARADLDNANDWVVVSAQAADSQT